MTNETATIATAINFDGKTLAIQFEAFSFFARASHGGDFFAMGAFNLAGRSGALAAIDIVESISRGGNHS